MGISGSYALSKIQELLRKGVSNGDLIEAVARASTSQKEQIATQGKTKSKCGSVYEASTSESSTVSKLFSAVGTLTRQVSNMQTKSNSFKSVHEKSNTFKCDNCTISILNRCNCCYKCDMAGHRRRYCGKIRETGTDY